MIIMKKCIKCSCKLIPEKNWAKSAIKKQYYICRKCNCKQQKLFRLRKPWVGRTNNLIGRLKVEGHKCFISKDIIHNLISSPCAYCGEIMNNFNGLDRVDSSKEYTIDNVVPCCKYCNWAKNDLSVKEFKEHINKIHHYLMEDNKK